MMLIGLFGGIDDSGSAAGLLGGGAALILFGVSLFSPRLVRPLASVTGRPLERLRGLTGRLARENAMRKPGRTASTAAALMIGLALIVFVTVFAAGINSSVAKTIDDSFRGEIAIQNSDGFSPFPRDALDEARKVDGVQTVSAITYATGELPKGGGEHPAGGGGSADARATCSRWSSRRAARPRSRRSGRTTRSSTRTSRAKKHLSVGDTLRVRTPTERTATFRVLGTVKGELDLLGKAIIDESATSQFGRLQPNFALARLAPDASPKDVQKAMERRAEGPLPDGRGAEPEPAEGPEQAAGEPGARADLRAAVARHRRVGVRDREHAGAVDPRAHPRARHAPRGGHVAPAGADDGALRGGDHRPDRRDPRDVLGCVFAALVSRPLADEGFGCRIRWAR